MSVAPDLGDHGKAHSFRLIGFWEYLPDQQDWILASDTTRNLVPIRRTATPQILVSFQARAPHLYAVCWEESGEVYSQLVPIGPILCNDIDIGPPPNPNMIAACIPFDDRAVASFVPDPGAICR